MSYASSPKNFPNFLQSFSQKLFQPTGIAVMASIGIHGLVGATLPYWPIASPEKPQQLRNVKLVQLTPEEQSRLPQLSPLAISPNQLQSLYPLPPSPSTTFPSLSSKDPSLLNLPPIGPLPPAGSGLSSSAKTQSSQQQQQQRQNSTKNTPLVIAPPSRQSILHGRDFQGQDLFNLTGALASATPLPDPNPIPNQTRTPSTFPSPSQTRTPSTFPSPSQTTTPSTFPSPSQTTTPSTFPSPTASPVASNPNPTTRSRDRGINPTTPTPRVSASPAPQPHTPTPPENNSRNSGGGTNEEYVRNSINALISMGGTDEIKKYEPISGKYPKEACLDRLSGRSIVTAKVNEQGNLVDTRLTAKSSSQFFDEIALLTVKGISFRATGKAILYQVPVDFEYNSKVCSTAKAPLVPDRSPDPTPSPNSSKLPDATPSPKS